MKDKLIALLAKIPELCEAAYHHSPFAAGVAIGYFFHPAIKLLWDLLAQGLKLIGWL